MNRFVPVALALALSACTGGQTNYPSLAPRPIEKLGTAEPAIDEAAPAVADPAIAPAVAQALAAGEAANRAFAAIVAAERRMIEGGARAAPGSDGWIRAQESLSRVAAARIPLTDAVQSLDTLHTDRGPAAPDPALERALARLQALDTAAGGAVTALATRLPQ